MSRRHRAEKREVTADSKYNSVLLMKLINKVMLHGKKSIAEKIVYQSIEKFAQKVNAPDPIEAFEKAVQSAQPRLEVKSRRVGGATYQVPIEIRPDRSEAIALKWLVMFSRKKTGRSMVEALAIELQDTYNGQGTTIKKRDETHRMAEANKAFAHYKW